MPTVRERNMISPEYSSSFSKSPIPTIQEKRLKIREYISWSVCFAIISSLTGLMKFLKVGITADTVTSVLFYLSLFGLGFFITRIISVSKNPVQVEESTRHELN